MSTTLATALINWNDLWKIIIAALVGGTGVAILFGLLLLGISRGKTATKFTSRYGLYSLSALCGALVITIACLGVYAMTQKSSPAKPKPKTATRTVAPASASQQRAARTA
jgi:uncharacterized membrane protein SpoIIM required for sporulation